MLFLPNLQQFALMLTSKGVAGVPRASLIVLAGTLTSFNIPILGVAVLLGIDQILDMGRTTVNLIGNCVATVVIARWENAFDYNKMADFIKMKNLKTITLIIEIGIGSFVFSLEKTILPFPQLAKTSV